MQNGNHDNYLCQTQEEMSSNSVNEDVEIENTSDHSDAFAVRLTKIHGLINACSNVYCQDKCWNLVWKATPLQ